MHGAALMHAVVMKPTAAVIELSPKEGHWKLFEYLASALTFVVIALRRIVENSQRSIRIHQSSLSSRSLFCDKSEMHGVCVVSTLIE